MSKKILVVFSVLISFTFVLYGLLQKDKASENISTISESVDAPSWLTTIVSPNSSIESKDLYTFNCETVEQKPELLTPYCADFGVVVYKIKWNDWSAYGAHGSGIYSRNDCNPDCADGTRHEQPIKIELKDLLSSDGKYYLNTAVITPMSKSKDSVSSETWDLGDYYRQVWAEENP